MQTSKKAIPLKKMLLRPLLLFLFVVWVTLCFLIYSPMRRIMDDKSRMGIEYGLSQRMAILNERFEEMVGCLNSVTSVAMKHGWSYLNNKSYWERAKSKERIQGVLDIQLLWRNNECLLLDLDEEKFLMGTTYLNAERTMKLLGQMEPAANSSGYILYQPIEWDTEGQYHLMMSFRFPVGAAGNQKNLIAPTVSSVPLDTLLGMPIGNASEAATAAGKVYLTDLAGEPLSHQEQSAEAVVRFVSDANAYGIRLVHAIPRTVYDRELRQLLFQMTLVVIAAGVMALLLVYLSLVKIQRPIKGVTDVIQNIRLGIPLCPASLKDTGIVEYNQILEYIEQADLRIRKEKEMLIQAEKEKRAKDVMHLRMQINPHFLYNALNAVQWMARCNQTQEIESYMNALMSILHYNLDEYGKHLVTLETELTLIEKYMTIHQHRYENEIACRIHGDPRLPVLIPRFILQPLVENAIYHGLQNKRGCIDLKIEQEENTLCLRVCDNGRGIQPEVLRGISGSNRFGMGIGIRYVSTIVSDYGGTLWIDNITEGDRICGTEAKITLPIMPAGPSDGDGASSSLLS